MSPYPKNKIRLAGIVNDSIVDGPGIRLTVFVQGCAHACLGCHNPETHDFRGGYDGDIKSIAEKAFSNPLLSGITLSGGDPLYQVPACLELLETIEGHGLDVVVYTGFLWEELLQLASKDETYEKFLGKIDFLIDGPFVLAKRDLTLHFRGSSNQRCIDVKKSLQSNSVVLTDW